MKITDLAISNRTARHRAHAGALRRRAGLVRHAAQGEPAPDRVRPDHRHHDLPRREPVGRGGDHHPGGPSARVATLSGLDDLRSTSTEGVSTVIAEFLPDKDIDEASREVREAVDRAKVEFPSDVEEPIVSDIDFADFPVLTVNLLTEGSLTALRETAEDLQDDLGGRAGRQRRGPDRRAGARGPGRHRPGGAAGLQHLDERRRRRHPDREHQHPRRARSTSARRTTSSASTARSTTPTRSWTLVVTAPRRDARLRPRRRRRPVRVQGPVRATHRLELLQTETDGRRVRAGRQRRELAGHPAQRQEGDGREHHRGGRGHRGADRTASTFPTGTTYVLTGGPVGAGRDRWSRTWRTTSSQASSS